jgi:hypothetical protein
MIVIYRHGAYFVALGVDAIILSQLLDLRLQIAYENKTLAKYVLFQFRGGENKLTELLNEVGYRTTFKLYPPTLTCGGVFLFWDILYFVLTIIRYYVILWEC